MTETTLIPKYYYKELKFLKNQETRIVDLLKEGLGNIDIAKKMNINQKTVSTYIARIKNKYGVHAKKNIYYLITKIDDLNYSLKNKRI